MTRTVLRMRKWSEAIIWAISCTFTPITTRNVSHYSNEMELDQVPLQFSQIILNVAGLVIHSDFTQATWIKVCCIALAKMYMLSTLLCFSVEVTKTLILHLYIRCIGKQHEQLIWKCRKNTFSYGTMPPLYVLLTAHFISFTCLNEALVVWNNLNM